VRTALVVVALALAGWFAYSRVVAPSFSEVADSQGTELENGASFRSDQSSSQYSCDGREYCSQMTSCEEAEFFLRNCPGVKMDGNNDGVPCESQWCGN
jgi:hypothetical protein